MRTLPPANKIKLIHKIKNNKEIRKEICLNREIHFELCSSDEFLLLTTRTTTTTTINWKILLNSNHKGFVLHCFQHFNHKKQNKKEIFFKNLKAKHIRQAQADNNLRVECKQ